MEEVRMETDIKAVARCIIQGNEKRKKRVKQNIASAFDIKAVATVEDALLSSCGNINSDRTRKSMQDKIYKSIVYNTPYEYIGATVCGRRQFYEYRMEFITNVASAMEMIPGNNQRGSEY